MLAIYKLRSAFDIVLIFLFVYALTFNGLPLPLSKIILGLVFLLNDKKKLMSEIARNRMLKYSFFVWAIFTIHYIFLIVFKENYTSLSFVRSIIWIFGECILGSYIMFSYLKNRYPFPMILKMVFITIFIQSIFVLLTFLSPALRDFINSVLSITDERGLSNYRMKGFSNFGGASLSYLQMLGVVYGGVILLLFKSDSKNRIMLTIGIFTIMLIQIFIGRTGLIASIFFIIIIFTQQAINNKSFFRLIIQSLVAIVLVFSLFKILINLIPQDLQTGFNDKIIARSIELYENFSETGELTTSSTEHLSTMYILPETDLGIIFGEAMWDETAGVRTYYGRLVDSDVGYVRVIFAVGAFVGLIFYSLYLLLIYDLWKLNNLKSIRLILIGLLLIFILGEFKEPFLVRPSGIIKSLFLLYFILYNTYKNNINLSNTLSTKI